MCFSKLALIRFIRDLTPASSDRRFAVSLQALTCVWALVGIVTGAFQCKPPRTWDYLEGQCFRIVCSRGLFHHTQNGLTGAAGRMVGLPRGVEHPDRHGDRRAGRPSDSSRSDEREEKGDPG